MIILCPQCEYPCVIHPSAAAFNCKCGCLFTFEVKIVKPSPLPEDKLKELRNQHRG